MTPLSAQIIFKIYICLLGMLECAGSRATNVTADAMFNLIGTNHVKRNICLVALEISIHGYM